MNSPEETTPFAVDPYAHQPDAEWKSERWLSDQRVLCEYLGMTSEEVFAASRSFDGRNADFFRFIVAVRFLAHALLNELKERATTLKVASAIFTVEGVAPPTLLPNRERLKRFLVRYLSRDDKLTMLGGFLFAGGHTLGGSGTRARHLMHARALADTCYRQQNFQDRDPDFCSTRPIPICFCAAWLAGQEDTAVDGFVEELGGRLYDMRNAVAHDAAPVFFASSTTERPPDAAQWSMTLVDVFPRDQRETFVRYESGLQVEDIVSIFRSGLRRCFEDGARF